MTVLSCLLLVLCACFAVNAYAAVNPPALSIDTCAPGYKKWDFTVKIVACVQNSVIGAMFNMLSALQNYMRPIAAALMALAIGMAGVRLIGGQKTGRSVMYAIRLGVVSWVWFNLSTFGGYVFSVEQQLITIVSGNYSPWSQIDNFLGNLIGFGPQIVLFQGLLGIISAALTSSSIGSMLFMAGFSAISSLLLFIFNVVYTYLASLIMLGFLIILSPIFLPFAVFFATERYIKKLMDMIVSVMLMPILLFAFVRLFMGIFDTMITDIFNNLPGNKNFAPFWNVNKPVFGWVMPSDQSLMERLQGIQGIDGGPMAAVPPVQTNVNPFLRHGFNAGSIGNLPGLNFGPNEPVWIQKIIMRLITLWLFAMLMKTMVSRIPEIASSIAGSVIGLPLSATSPTQVLKNVQSSAEMGFGAMTGGAAGGEIGAAAAKAAGGNARDQQFAREGGGVMGAIAGMMVTKR